VGQPHDEVHRHLSPEGCLPCYSEGRVRQVDHRGHKEPLDDYTDKISSMAVRYARFGTTLDDTTMVKKLLDTVPDQLYPAVAGIEQFYDVKTMPFQEVLSRLRGRCQDKCSQWSSQAGGEWRDDQLMLAEAKW
jgi:hypothetical protein